MITNKKIFFTGILLIIIPLLGFPLSWKFFLVICAAIFLIISSVKMSMPARLPKQFSHNQFFRERKPEKGEYIPTYQKMPDIPTPMVENEIVVQEIVHTPKAIPQEKKPRAVKMKASPKIRKRKNTDILPPQ